METLVEGGYVLLIEDDDLTAIALQTVLEAEGFTVRRAADGHPAPFTTPYLEIGNEDWLDRSGSYEQYRYAAFYDALKAAHPDIKLIATTAVTSRPMDVLDLHYYQSESWFEDASTLFDSYDRTGPRIFVGEYAGTANADRAIARSSFCGK